MQPIPESGYVPTQPAGMPPAAVPITVPVQPVAMPVAMPAAVPVASTFVPTVNVSTGDFSQHLNVLNQCMIFYTFLMLSWWFVHQAEG